MGAPPPHEGPCKRCGGDEDVTKLGRYRGLCKNCRSDVARERRETQIAQTMEKPVLDRSDFENKSPGLKRACETLTKRAEALETALKDKRLAHDRAKAALANFNETLRVVGAAARVLVDGGPGPEE